jgi:5-methylcytosine-specific restriction endonuclease McrA
MSSTKAKLLKQQQGKCKMCGLHFQEGDILEIDHIQPLTNGEKRIIRISNYYIAIATTLKLPLMVA